MTRLTTSSIVGKTLVALTLLLPIKAAFTPTFSTSTSQCGAFTISWASTDSARAGPPFNLLLVPVNDAASENADDTGHGSAALSLPLVQAVPDAAWDATTNSGTYTVNALPFRTGERFIVVMDDGFGLGTGGVSSIQTVGSTPAGTSCLGQTTSGSNIEFSFDTLQPSQCAPLSIVTAQASSIRGFVPGGSAFSLELPAASTGDMTTVWNVNVPAESSFVLVYSGKDGKFASSGLIKTAAASSSDCTANGPHSTETAAPTSSGTSGSTSQTRTLSGSSVITRVTPSSTGTRSTVLVVPSSSSSSASTSGSRGRTAGISLVAFVGCVIGAAGFLV